ncbi:unnamed protein product [Sympodiomycopsis kandeliae]
MPQGSTGKRKRTHWIDLIEDELEPSSQTEAIIGDDQDYLSSTFVQQQESSQSSRPIHKSKPILSKNEIKELETARTRHGLTRNLFNNDNGQADSPALRMMQNMGFTPGQSIGLRSYDQKKDSIASSLVEPIVPNLSFQAHRAGIGRSLPVEQEHDQGQEEGADALAQEHQFDAFRSRMAEEHMSLQRNALVTQAAEVLNEFDQRAGYADQVTDAHELTLVDLLNTLRSRHHYCLFCGCQYSSRNDLSDSCPGPSQDDHD